MEQGHRQPNSAHHAQERMVGMQCPHAERKQARVGIPENREDEVVMFLATCNVYVIYVVIG